MLLVLLLAHLLVLLLQAWTAERKMRKMRQRKQWECLLLLQEQRQGVEKGSDWVTESLQTAAAAVAAVVPVAGGSVAAVPVEAGLAAVASAATVHAAAVPGSAAVGTATAAVVGERGRGSSLQVQEELALALVPGQQQDEAWAC